MTSAVIAADRTLESCKLAAAPTAAGARTRWSTPRHAPSGENLGQRPSRANGEVGARDRDTTVPWSRAERRPTLEHAAYVRAGAGLADLHRLHRTRGLRPADARFGSLQGRGTPRRSGDRSRGRVKRPTRGSNRALLQRAIGEWLPDAELVEIERGARTTTRPTGNLASWNGIEESSGRRYVGARVRSARSSASTSRALVLDDRLMRVPVGCRRDRGVADPSRRMVFRGRATSANGGTSLRASGSGSQAKPRSRLRARTSRRCTPDGR